MYKGLVPADFRTWKKNTLREIWVDRKFDEMVDQAWEVYCAQTYLQPHLGNGVFGQCSSLS